MIETRDGAQLFLRDWGSGPPVLFLHAWALTSQSWQYQMSALVEAGFRCIAFDRRGHGRSSDPGGGYDLATLADDVAAVVDALKLERFVLVGHSLGAAEAVTYLLRHGEARVRRLVLVAPTTPYLPRTADNPDGLDPQVTAFGQKAFRHDLPGIVGANIKPFVVPETPASTIAWIETMFGQASLQAIIETQAAFSVADFRAELPNLTVPTLVLQGDADASAPLALTGVRTAALIPGAKLTVIKGAPHGLILTHVDEVNAALLEVVKV
jgi:pimeloyl-ACP methyl ester carboxylesterase